MIDNDDIRNAYESLERIKTRDDINVDEEVLFAALSLFTWAGMKKKGSRSRTQMPSVKIGRT
ncbi:MAG: hypothetical protein GY775_14745 [Candidatus Scalindua sp.]|nr:hypothetical protein [Candidatus Scalindua sp.]